MFKTPILFLVFNRPDTTARVFQTIKAQEPKFLYVAADGPRDNKTGEFEKCEETRKIVIENIDWPCEVKTLFREKNLGCGKAVSSAIAWFFENVEEGIILEDDCLPHPEFFSYCTIMLEHYRYSNEVMFIGGDNFQVGKKRGNYSYYFSKYSHVWGWATWKRVWNNYSFTLEDFSEIDFDRTLKRHFSKNEELKYWKDLFLKMKQTKIDTWDYQVNFAIWKQNGVSVIPNVNLVSNIGFGSGATHTTENTSVANLMTDNILPISHPPFIEINRKADQFFFKKYIGKPYFTVIIFMRIKDFMLKLPYVSNVSKLINRSFL